MPVVKPSLPSFGLALDELVSPAAEVDRAKMEHRLGSGHGPPHAGAFHAVFDEMAADAFGDAPADWIARGAVLVVPHVLPIVRVVRERRIDPPEFLTFELMAIAESSQAAKDMPDFSPQEHRQSVRYERRRLRAALRVKAVGRRPQSLEHMEQIENADRLRQPLA